MQNELNITARIKSKNIKIKSVEVITNNNYAVYSEHNIDNKDFNKKIKISSNNSFSYYFLKTYYENGETSFTTPIWIENDKKTVFHSIKEKPILSGTNKYATSISFDVENISDEYNNVTDLTITDINDKILHEDKLSLKKREVVNVRKEIHFDNTSDDTIKITLKSNDYTFEQFYRLKKTQKIAKIVFDISHNNIFSQDFGKVTGYLKNENHIVDIESSPSIFDEYDNMKKYDIVIISSPIEVFELVDKNMKFFYVLNKYVYNGGVIILAGYFDERTKAPMIFMNECLRVVFSPIRYSIDGMYNLFPITDDGKNYLLDKYIPIFTDVFPKSNGVDIKSIYLKNPIEFRSNSGLPVTKLYNIKSIININETTQINYKTLKNHRDYSAGVIHPFGFGKVVVLSGINFSDYDIDNLDNKKWFINLIKYLIESK